MSKRRGGLRRLRNILKSESGGIIVYASIFSVIGIGAGGLAIDYGRMVFLKSQMQNRADAAALAAAVYLDGSKLALTRADEVAKKASFQTTGQAADGYELKVQYVKFYSSWLNKTLATDHSDARFIEVHMEPRKVGFLMAPILNLLSGVNDAEHHYVINVKAVARADSFVCNAPPLMMCDPAEEHASFALEDPANTGKMYRLKEPQAGNGTWAPGNFGLLATPDGDSGAAAIKAALASPNPTGCYILDVTTAPGSKTNMVKEGINTRFDVPLGTPNPAPNVLNYPRDKLIKDDITTKRGNGDWDAAIYWNDKHGTSLPVELGDPSRFQVYLYELGLTFAANGKQTLFPAPDPLPAGFTKVVPPGPSIPTDPADPNNNDVDGVPSVAPAVTGPFRRVSPVAVVKCEAEDVKGAGTFPTAGKFAIVFITETVKDPPDAAIYAELIGVITPSTSLDFHANARLVE